MNVMAMSLEETGTDCGISPVAAQTFGTVLNRARVRAGLSMEAVARRLRRSTKSVQKLIYDQVNPSCDTLLRAMAEFDEVLDWALARAGREKGNAEALLEEIHNKLQERKQNGAGRL